MTDQAGPTRIQVEIQTGYASPWAGSFETPTVTIGRGVDADVRLHPTKDTACARTHHAVLERDGPNTWRVMARHPSGVRVVDRSGRTIAKLSEGESHAIDGEVQFELGEGGPRLGAFVVGEALPVTEARPTGGVPLPVGRVSGDVERRARQAPKLIAGVAALFLLVCAGLAYWLFVVDHKGQVVEDITLDLHGQTRELIATTEDVRTRTEALSEQAEALRSTIETGTQLTSAQLDAIRDSVTELREQPSDRIAGVLLEASPSVWFTAVYNPETGAIIPMGTSWTLAPGMLGTNAHVAEAVEGGLRYMAGGVPVVFREGRRDQMVELDRDMIMHPGYKRWGEVLATQLQVGPGGEPVPIGFVVPCDVAILKPKDPDVDLGRPLPIASNVGEAEYAGTTVGYVGFPTENLVGLPSIQRVSGRVTNQTDFVFQPSPVADAQLIHHTAVSAGGSSGSPLLNEQGEVVGLVSAGSLVAMGGRRIPVGFNYAQRADLIAELRDGDADRALQERTKRFVATLRRVMVTAPQVLSRLVFDVFQTEEHHAVDLEGVLRGSGSEGAITTTIELEPGHRYAIAVASEDWHRVHLSVLQGETLIAQDLDGLWFAVVSVFSPPVGKAEITVVVQGLSLEEGETGRVRVRVARVQARPPGGVRLPPLPAPPQGG